MRKIDVLRNLCHNDEGFVDLKKAKSSQMCKISQK